MTGREQWLAANEEYLATALDWLRRRLERLAAEHDHAVLLPREEPVTVTLEPGPPRQRSLRHWLRWSEAAPPDAAKGLPPASGGPPLLTVGAPEAPPMPAAMIEAEAAPEPPALPALARRLGLTEFEQHTLLLCAAMELDTTIAGLCARAQRDATRAYPTIALALTLFDEPAWDVLSPERPLRAWRLVEISQPGSQPLVTSAIKADERIVNYIKGLNYLDDRLVPLIIPIVVEEGGLSPGQARIADGLIQLVPREAQSTPAILFQLLGPDSEAKRLVASATAHSLGRTLYRLPVEVLPQDTGDLETFIRLWQRESRLLPLALYLDASHLDRTASPHLPALQRLLGRGVGLVFFDSREPWPDLDGESLLVEVLKPTPAEQLDAWRDALDDSAEDEPALLAGQFSFNLPTIRAIAAEALAAPDGQGSLGERLWAGCLGHARPSLDQLAQALGPKATWEDLELPTAEKLLLRQIADQVKRRLAVYDDWGFRERMNRGLGISVLFAGESGTGKTMAAEVIANELRLLLYRVDLSAVVSKYIGETEKNLRRLFDAAEDGGAILFFDEADALFGKRSEVKDSHDRYANIEINYLLQRMETYRGLAILATNMKASLDNAFVRRLRFIVNFPFPGPDERLAIWQKVFPPQTPLGDVDFERLAKLNLTGGSIHSIALNAAFLAASAHAEVGMASILEAARNEFQKLEKPIVNETDFRWLESTEGAA